MPHTPPDAHASVMDAYFTCELATINKSGVPIAWPVVTLRRDDGTFLITTSIALPQKVFNIRREPKVAMLFSDPTGSGYGTLPEILVRGTAVCPDEVVTSPDGLEPYWIKLWRRQPPLPLFSARSPVRRFFDWYFMRLLISVTPVRVTERLALDVTAPASTASAGPAPTGPALSAVSTPAQPYRQTNAALADHRSAVLATLDPEGFPSLRRVRLTADPSRGAFLIDAPGAGAPRPGPASILCHKHDDALQKQRAFVSLGHVGSRDGVWTFTPTRFIQSAGDDSPAGVFRAMRTIRHTAARYLAARGLSRPRIPWSAFEALKRQATRPVPVTGTADRPAAGAWRRRGRGARR